METKYIGIRTPGGPENLEVMAEDSIPLMQGQIRVRIEAIGVNQADALMRKGLYHSSQLPAVPGFEACGHVIESKGETQVGSKVILFAGPGLYREVAVAHEKFSITVPEGLDSSFAAALPVNWLSAYYCLNNLLQMKRGESIFINASASGVGTAAIQLARHQGLKVIAGAGSDEKLELSKSLGAEILINYEEEPLTDAILNATGGKGADGAIDLIGGAFFRPIVKGVGSFGRVVSMANLTMEDSPMNTRDFYPKNISIFGFQLGALISSGRWDARVALSEMANGVLKGDYQPVIHKTFPLNGASNAHIELAKRSVMGKLILLNPA